MTSFDIIDVEFLYLIDPIDGAGWSVWAVDAHTSDGEVIRGSCQGDGISNFAVETFEQDLNGDLI